MRLRSYAFVQAEEKGAVPMSLYDLLLFTHISGALGFFSGILAWMTALSALRRARRTEEVHVLTAFLMRANVAAIIGVLILLAAGITMTVTTWGFATPWIDVTLGSLVPLAAGSTIFIESPMQTLAERARQSPDGPVPADLIAIIHRPLLGMALTLRVLLVLGIVFLMVTKPALVMSLVVMAGALVLGLVICLPQWIIHRRLTLQEPR